MWAPAQLMNHAWLAEFDANCPRLLFVHVSAVDEMTMFIHVPLMIWQFNRAFTLPSTFALPYLPGLITPGDDGRIQMTIVTQAIAYPVCEVLVHFWTVAAAFGDITFRLWATLLHLETLL